MSAMDLPAGLRYLQFVHRFSLKTLHLQATSTWRAEQSRVRDSARLNQFELAPQCAGSRASRPASLRFATSRPPK